MRRDPVLIDSPFGAPAPVAEPVAPEDGDLSLLEYGFGPRARTQERRARIEAEKERRRREREARRRWPLKPVAAAEPSEG